MTDDPDLPLNCPWCGLRMEYAATAFQPSGSIHYYDCPVHGQWLVPPDGRIQKVEEELRVPIGAIIN